MTVGANGREAPAAGVRYEQIAEDIRSEIRSGKRVVGDLLESEAVLAGSFGVSPGTVREALRLLVAEGTLSSRRGARKSVLRVPRAATAQEEFRSFAQWAMAHGRQPGGRVVEQRWEIAGEETGRAIMVDPRSRVLRVLRVRSLDGERVMVERTSYPERLGVLVETMPPDLESVTRELTDVHGIVFAGADHVFSAAVCGQQDAALLGVARGRPLLRHRRVSRSATGEPLEVSEDRYLANTLSVAVSDRRAVNAIGWLSPEESGWL
ncbi:MAG TPA: GntR family transcriptional regulator [Candidatus Brevibacterium intestinigallinarum]|nr:GntR family transcriptional regulator [Candidatus Brevibacterium intestinigallinarum]